MTAPAGNGDWALRAVAWPLACSMVFVVGLAVIEGWPSPVDVLGMALLTSIPALAFTFVLAWIACLLGVIWQRVFRRFGRRTPLWVKVAVLVVTTAGAVGGVVAGGLLLFNPNGLNGPQAVGVSNGRAGDGGRDGVVRTRVFRDRTTTADEVAGT